MQWNCYMDFCDQFQGHDRLPATPQVLCAYVTYLTGRMRAVGTVANYLSGVKTLHLLQGVHLDSFKDISVKLVLKGAGRVLQHVVRQRRQLHQ